MVFSSMIFLFVFFPITAAAYYLCPIRLRNVVLLAASLFFYAWGEPVCLFLMIFSTVFDYGNGRILEKVKTLRMRRAVLVLSLAGNLGILFFFKYRDFFIENVNWLSGSRWEPGRLVLPIGISFYTFQTMSYTIDVYRGVVRAQRNIITFALYVCLFPQLIAGPIVRYQTVRGQLVQRITSFETCYQGLYRFLAGLGKKVLFANTAGALWEEIRDSAGTSDMSVLAAWLGAVCFAFQIYFDFSGYSDMAIGLGKFFGFDFPENFRYPYEAKSVTEFWRRWHISLGSWFRDYLYIPLGGSAQGFGKQVRNLFVVWFLTGLWHGASWNYVLWGLYFFVLLLMEKCWLLRHLKRCPAWMQHGYGLFFIVVGWVIFACEDGTVLLSYLRSMFGVGVPLFSSMGMYDLITCGIFLVVLGIATTSLAAKAGGRYRDTGRGRAAAAIISVFILVMVLPLLIRDSYNPFLYFRF